MSITLHNIKNDKKGLFITVEGPEGSGKTSQIPPLAEYLRHQGYAVQTTREPDGTAIGSQIRSILFSMDNKAMVPRTETLLFCAARAQHVDELIRPCLEKGMIVICDRYSDSTLAYQGYGHNRDLSELRSLLDYATSGLYPDLTLLLDLEVEVGLQRRRKGGDWNRLDDYAIAFHRRVRQGYHELMRSSAERWIVVDANQPIDVVQQVLCRAVMSKLSH